MAVALVVKEKYGGQQVAWVFLVQTLPAILFSRGLAQLIPESRQEKFYWISQLILAANCLVLCFTQSLPAIYIHLFVAASLKSISTPLFNTLIGRWTSKDNVDVVFTKVGSIQTATLALAPIAGAWIKIVSSAEILFLVDALSFVLSVLLLWDVLRVQRLRTEKVNVKVRDFFATVIKVPQYVPANLWRALLLWFGFLLLGALINALEFARFDQLAMNEKMIGYALAGWGVGSLLAFVRKFQISISWSGGLFFGSLVAFLMVSSIFAVIGIFVLAGWSSSLFSGMLRGQIQKTVPAGFNALPVWAFTNQITQVINLLAYVGVGLLLNVVGFGVFTIIVILVGLLIQVALITPSVLQKNIT
ncbi:MAG TPA: MFS transporter, partial [Bdellovibrio sp.]